MGSRRIPPNTKIQRGIIGPRIRDRNQVLEILTRIRELAEAFRRGENWPRGLIVGPIRPVERVIQNRECVVRTETPRPDNNETEDRASQQD